MVNLREIYTIGHSTRSITEFLELLDSFSIGMVADVRSFPGSRRFPHFNRESLSGALVGHNIHYMHIPELGGRRSAATMHASFASYTEHMKTEEFRKGIQRLESVAAAYRTAYMCSEAAWQRCHRSYISDHLKLNHWKVIHIVARGEGQEHPDAPPAPAVQGTLF